MNEIIFSKAKNSLLTCSISGLQLHSAYQPDTEAKRFVDSLKPDFSPSVVFIIEPALSYTAPFLRQKFPEKKICAIRLTKGFEEYDQNFDKVFYFVSDKESNSLTSDGKSGSENYEEKTIDFETALFTCFPEIELCSSLFIVWPASEKIFSESIKKLSASIKNVIEKSKASLVTQSYFSRRWFSNKIIFYSQLAHTVFLKKGNQAVVMAASGPSLNSSVPSLKKMRNHFYLIAASSALEFLLKNQIIPDLVVLTDGGYWAKNHLLLNLEKYDFTFALPDEAALPRSLFKTRKILPLLYEDSSEKEKQILKNSGIPFFSISRNGTVSGTLLEISKKLTSNSIFAFGLDLQEGKGKQHAEPNKNETNDSRKENRVLNKETRLTGRRFNSKSLEIYRNWFSSLNSDETENVFRVNPDFSIKNQLGNIKDIDLKDFEKQISEMGIEKNRPEITEHSEKILSEKERKELQNEAKKMVEYYETSDQTDKMLFPSEVLYINKTLDENKKKEIQEKLLKRKRAFFEKLKGSYDL